jgi:hypothetical protein
MRVTVPTGATATVVVPDSPRSRHEVGSGTHEFTVRLPALTQSPGAAPDEDNH